jgi:hypothetical protein
MLPNTPNNGIGNVISHQKQIEFLLYIQRLLAEGQFTSTYKFALILSIANVCAERDVRPDGTLRIEARELAGHFIEFYWRQAIKFNGVAILKQNTRKQAAIINYIIDSRERVGGSLPKLRSDSRKWSKLVKKVANKIDDMPLWRLQNLDGEKVDYLYEKSQFRQTITLKSGIAFCFRLFHGLIIQLVQSSWLEFVLRLKANRDVLGASGNLEEFMFGSDRSILKKFTPILREFQKDVCFYCDKLLYSSVAEVDHFIPWSRYNADLGHNFVLTHAGCNRDKLDRLPGIAHLEKWIDRNENKGKELGSEFGEHGLIHDLPKTIRIARFAYGQAEVSGSYVWIEKKNHLEPLTADWRKIIGESSLLQ